MEHSRRVWWFRAVVATLALLVSGTSSAAEPAPTQREGKFEVRFMTDMIDHHMMAIMMAEHCLDKAVHPELIEMCEEIIAAQTAEMELMQGWLQDWYGISYEPEMPPGMHRMMERLASLAPEDFEITFMQMMIRHHWQAVIEGEHCLDRAYHPELLQTCSDIVSAQTEEIATMQEWLCEWYGRCRQGPQVQ